MKRNAFTFLLLITLAALTGGLCGCSQTVSPSPSPSPAAAVTVTPATPASAVPAEDQRYLKRYGRDGAGQPAR